MKPKFIEIQYFLQDNEIRCLEIIFFFFFYINKNQKDILFINIFHCKK